MRKIIKIGKLVKDAWLMVGITMLLLCLLEISFSIAFFIKDRVSASDLPTDGHGIADTYSDPTWVNDYNAEFDRSFEAHWRPYVYWRRKPYRGNYINVDAKGIRLTTSAKPIEQGSRSPLKIFILGGSTMWGTGARDAFTIPSILAQELQRNDVATELINFGESGYVSTQEVITLQLQLQKGYRSDLVIFYDGVNDTYSAYQQGVAGLPQNEFNRVNEFNLSQPEKSEQRTEMVLQDVASKTSTMRFLKSFLQKKDAKREAGVAGHSFPIDELAPKSVEALAQDVLSIYRGNIEIVKALSEHYHFKFLFYWQPTIFQKAHMTEYERAQQAKMQTVEQFFHKTYEVVQQSRLTETHEYLFHDLTLAFADVREPVYIDWCHLGESGNAIIAKRMARDVLDLIIANK